MEITKLIKKQEDGTFEATIILTEEQTKFLVNFAIGMLVQSGIATVIEQEVDTLPSNEQASPPAKKLN